jgi:hypothetical protein
LGIVPTIGPVEVLVFLVLAALVVYFALRRRVPTGVLILLIIVLSPVVAVALATLLGVVLSVISGR